MVGGMAVVWIPTLMRDLTGGQQTISLTGSTVRQLIDELEQQFPGIKARLCTAEGLRPGVAVIVDGIASPLGWLQAVRPESEVHFVPAISGG
jgi:molybdopterin synthase sulfur carrier subunit